MTPSGIPTTDDFTILLLKPTTAVPEPGFEAMLYVGLSSLGVLVRRRARCDAEAVVSEPRIGAPPRRLEGRSRRAELAPMDRDRDDSSDAVAASPHHPATRSIGGRRAQ
jgi:hypothetical protein